jgi:hypothetical protein
MKTVIEMAKEAGLIDFRDPLSAEYTKAVLEDLTTFAGLVRADERERIYFQNSSDFVKAAIADEREACAKVVEASPSYDWHKFACEAAAAIRARSNT